MSYIDTSVLISYVNPDDSLHDKAVKLIDGFHEKKLVSDLTIIELYSVFSRTMNLSNIEIEALVKYTLRKTNVEKLSVKWDRIYRRAIKLANELKLKSLDLLHITIASLSNCRFFATFDKDILRKSAIIREKLGLEIVN